MSTIIKRIGEDISDFMFDEYTFELHKTLDECLRQTIREYVKEHDIPDDVDYSRVGFDELSPDILLNAYTDHLTMRWRKL